MTTKDEALKLALEALTATMSTHGFQKHIDQAKDDAITAIQQARSAPVQPEHISPKQLLALAQEANLGLDKVIEVFRMAAQPSPVQHNTNAWADMAANGLQWVRNIVDGVSDPVVALANLEENLKHCEAAPTPPAAPVPEGWKHVPIEPTDEMLDAAQAVVKDIYRVDADRVYAAMLNNIPVAQEAAHGITKVQP
jgi:hypothetical protein